MITDNLHTQIVDAMKKGEALRVSTLKMLASELHNYQIDHPNMSADEEMTIVKKEAKKRKDAIEAYENAGRQELADKEKSELVILQEFLPEEMSDQELRDIVESVIVEVKPTGMQDMGRVIGAVMQKTQGRADGGSVSALVKEKISSL